MTPNTNDLLIFLAVAEMRGFTAAAQVLGLTKSAVSQAVRRIEDALGAKVFFRSTRSLSLTDTGSRLLPHCRSLQQVQQDMMSEFSRSESALRDTLTITAPHALCRFLVVPALKKHLTEHDLNVRLIAEDAQVNLVEQRVDLAIRVGGTAPQTAYTARIGWLHESLYAAESYVQEMGGLPSSVMELENWSHIANEWQGNPLVYKGPQDQSLSVTPQIRCNTILDVAEFVAGAHGTALLPEIVAREIGRHSHLIHLFSISKTPVYALHQHGNTLPVKLRSFIRLLRKTLAASTSQKQETSQ